jgi:hypothetical protein
MLVHLIVQPGNSLINAAHSDRMARSAGLTTDPA